MISKDSKIAVIAPHPDDETIALGGTISRFSKLGCKVSVLIVSGHLPPLYLPEMFEKTLEESKEALSILGVSDYHFARIPATFVHQKPISELNKIISKFVKESEADIVFIPYPDRHIDHRTIFDSSVVACRPIGENPPKLVLSYETLSETHWNVPGIEPQFCPEVFIDISQFLEKKLEALSAYQSQIKNNDSRSIEACRALARFRGSQNGCRYAEAYKLVRMVI
tara:strand:+ start:41 stop:712 length:672 start_codon:yes stop_codon:yes gene_type:complete